MNKVIFGIREYTKGKEIKSHWTKIGRVLENKDGSLNCIFDYFPRDSKTRIQIREETLFEEKNSAKAEVAN